MRGLYTGLASWNLVVLLGFAVLGLVDQLGVHVDSRSLQVAALFSAFFCCLVQSILVAHFIGSMKWIQQSGPTAGIEDTKPLRTAWIKGRMFPLVTICMLLAVAASILSGGTAMEALPAWTWLVLAFAGVPLNFYALVLARTEIGATKHRLKDLEAKMQTRIDSGEVKLEEDTPELREESGRAAGKVCVFLSVNVWVLFVYFRFVLRQHGEPWIPYAVASAVLLLVGLGMLRNTPDTDSDPEPSKKRVTHDPA
ncbi:MAG: hypothetical protein QNJ98_19915 [Planctomycetota bacterium]|nr:hypothetical protein [Planctomycetota bacterium]